VQLTWGYNYKEYGRILGIPLFKEPDRAMEPAIACFILVHGFKYGIFTGRKITDYIRQGKTDFVGARRCINGTDKAGKIAQIAVRRLKAMS
jgi:predicted chitinase